MLPSTLAANTIYILEPGRHVISNQLSAGGNCVAVVGKGIVTLYTTGDTAISSTISASSKRGIIIDNIRIDGLSNGSDKLRGTMTSANAN